jgi:hypothetical protein
MNQINPTIAERILKLERLDGPMVRYKRPDVEAGSAANCPNFLEFSKDQALLREEMSRRGFTLDIFRTPVDWEANTGKSCTAIFSRSGSRFESTQPYEYWAVCMAALLSVGWQPPE